MCKKSVIYDKIQSSKKVLKLFMKVEIVFTQTLSSLLLFYYSGTDI